jgi:hypothetical protein
VKYLNVLPLLFWWFLAFRAGPARPSAHFQVTTPVSNSALRLRGRVRAIRISPDNPEKRYVQTTVTDHDRRYGSRRSRGCRALASVGIRCEIENFLISIVVAGPVQNDAEAVMKRLGENWLGD